MGFQKKWAQRLFFIGLGAVLIYGMIYVDVVSRAKESFNEGEKYMAWNEHPELKQKYYDDWFASEMKNLETLHTAKKISDADFAEKSESLAFEKKFNLDESSLKYATQWYRDTFELFSPPESKWVRAARLKAPIALDLWKKELRAKNISFEDYMFE